MGDRSLSLAASVLNAAKPFHEIVCANCGAKKQVRNAWAKTCSMRCKSALRRNRARAAS